MKKILIILIALFLTACTDNSIPVITSDKTISEETSQVTSEIVFSETSVSDMDNDILQWISEYLEPHILTREENYIKEITFSITSDRLIPDMFIWLKNENDSSRETLNKFVYDNGDVDGLHITYPFQENTKEHITTPIMRDGNMGVKIDEISSYNGIYKSEIGMMDLKEFAPKLIGTQIFDSDNNSFGIFEITRIINFYPEIFNHYGKSGIGKFSANSQEYFYGKTNFIDKKMNELKENPDVLIDYIKANYYNSTTGLYEMYFGEEGIIDYLRYGKEYEYPGGENLRNIVVTKEEYEKLYAQLMGLFTETEFPWVYKSGILPDNYTKENLNQIAREASKSYLEYVASSNKE